MRKIDSAVHVVWGAKGTVVSYGTFFVNLGAVVEPLSNLRLSRPGSGAAAGPRPARAQAPQTAAVLLKPFYSPQDHDPSLDLAWRSVSAVQRKAVVMMRGDP